MTRIEVKRAQTERERIIGLIAKKKPYPLLLKTRFGIHTFGVRFPIDVVILNDTQEVMDLYEHMKPNRIFLWNPRYKVVLELPPGTIHEKKIQIGSRLTLVVK